MLTVQIAWPDKNLVVLASRSWCHFWLAHPLTLHDLPTPCCTIPCVWAGDEGRTTGCGQPAWIWIALCRATRQVAADTVGDRSEVSCWWLWNAMPALYRSGTSYYAFWRAYQAIIPEE